MNANKRGGPREGAGRPKLVEGRRVQVTLDQETLDILTKVDRNRSSAIRKLAKRWDESR
jgi:hypothetical protein